MAGNEPAHFSVNESYALSHPGGSVKAEGLGDGRTYASKTIAKLRLTLPPNAPYHWDKLTLSLQSRGRL